jgi:hypothetical protein
VYDCERRSKQLLDDALAAQQHERDARQALASAREGQAAVERALQQQTQRLLAAERMRLTDLKVCWVGCGPAVLTVETTCMLATASSSSLYSASPQHNEPSCNMKLPVCNSHLLLCRCPRAGAAEP